MSDQLTNDLLTTDTKELPILPLRDVVVYPSMVIPLFVGRRKSIHALESSMASDKQIMLVSQRNPSDDNPNEEDIYRTGTVSTILQLLKLPDGTVKVLVEGNQRALIESIVENEELATARVSIFESSQIPLNEADILVRSLISQFEQYIKLSKKVPAEVLASVASIEDPGRLADTVAAHMALKLEQKQKILEMVDIHERLEHLMALIEAEIDLLQVEKRIRGRVKKQMEKSQREYFLNEQIKAIQKELGQLDEGGLDEVEELTKKIENCGMTKEAKQKALAELSKLKLMSPMAAEATVTRSYIDWLVTVPWKVKSETLHDIAKAKSILDKDHYGLEEVKERILEYLAVLSRVKKLTGPILCLVGPPGVGKTSLGKSIAKATNRQYVRMALGGVRDEAEIRGHRRTYIGSMPGKIIQKMTKSKVKNPLFLLDEIDKMGIDMRGDPASALLEVLDPEQNNSFNDHYLEVDYDLSDVMFVCTSNSMDIPAPLLDRMEVIRIPGYTEVEKINISKQYLIPKAIENNGLKGQEISFDEGAIKDLIRYYTKEAGVRSLEREISRICRKVVKENVEQKKNDSVPIKAECLEYYSGVRKYSYGRAGKENRIGQVTGLAWTSVGGELLTIEAVAVKGKGKYTKTGSLGDVMQESIQAALTVVRSRASFLGIHSDFYESHDIHIHVPEGATPKDGPSAGIGMCTAVVSVLTGIAVKADVAMTGEITLRGEVLPIGGLKEKLLAALRGNIQTVIIPKENERDLKDIPDDVKETLSIHSVEWIDQVLELALESMPRPIEEQDIAKDAIKQVVVASDDTDRDNSNISTH